MRVRAKVMVALAIVVAVLVAVGAVACADRHVTASSSEVSSAPSSSTTATSAPAPTSTAVTDTGETTDPLSDRIAYAKSLGGVPHEGASLFFVVGATTDTEGEAQALLEKALPYFGDMQSYFIVQQSDNFDGMEPGKWVVIEAYKENPSAENVDFGRRGFPNAYVLRATVKTSDPIPVYEDRLGL